MKRVKIDGIECLRCQHQWVPTVEHPYSCPVCKSQYYDKERERPYYPRKGERIENGKEGEGSHKV